MPFALEQPLHRRLRMVNSSTASNFIFNIGSIKSIHHLRTAIKHNKREIQAELGAKSYINIKRIRENYSIIPSIPVTEIIQKIKHSILEYENNTGRKIRKNAVLALEILFSLPNQTPPIDHQEYFNACCNWAVGQFNPACLASAEVHLDESNPHLHAIFLCVGKDSLLGSMLKGGKIKFARRQDDFFEKVASGFGLKKPSKKLHKIERTQLANQVIEHIIRTNDPLIHSRAYPVVLQLIREIPKNFALAFGVEIETDSAPVRTCAEIFTSDGAGSNHHREL